MGRVWCDKHQRIVTSLIHSFDEKPPRFKLKCGCIFSRKKLEKWRVSEKKRFYLPDGREIIKIVPTTSVRWKIAGTKELKMQETKRT